MKVTIRGIFIAQSLTLSLLLLIATSVYFQTAVCAQIPGLITPTQSPSQKLEVGKVEQQQPLMSSVLTYENPRYGIKMQYPIGWNKTELNNNVSKANTNNNGNYTKLVSFHSPYENNSDSYSEALYLTVYNLPSNNIPLVEYTKAKIASLQRTFTNFQLVGSYVATLAASNPANEIVFLGKVPSQGANLKMMEVYAIRGDKAYDLAYFAEPSRYGTYLPVIQKMVDSFEISSPLLGANNSLAVPNNAVTGTPVAAGSTVGGHTAGSTISHTSQHHHNPTSSTHHTKLPQQKGSTSGSSGSSQAHHHHPPQATPLS